MAFKVVPLNPGAGGANILTDEINGDDVEVIKNAFGVEGDLQLVSSGNPLPVTGVFSITPTKSTTGTSTSVAQSDSNVNLLAANSARLGATIYNDSMANLFVLMGTTASLTSFTVRLAPTAYYEVPFSYVGNIDGIWDAAGSGNARITNLS